MSRRSGGRLSVTGPSSWDGYAAAAVSDAAVAALHSGVRTPVRLRDMLNLYAKHTAAE